MTPDKFKNTTHLWCSKCKAMVLYIVKPNTIPKCTVCAVKDAILSDPVVPTSPAVDVDRG